MCRYRGYDMGDVLIDVQLIEGLGLPYQPGADSELTDEFSAAWAEVVTQFPGLSLDPLFASVERGVIMDVVDAIRMGGQDPPDLFRWFEVVCEEALAHTLPPVLRALPFVSSADV